MENSVSAFTLLELFRMGGILMWPLLFFSIIAVGITLERAIYLLYHNLKLLDLKERVESCIRNSSDSLSALYSHERRAANGSGSVA